MLASLPTSTRSIACAVLLFTTGCAGSYRPIRPERITNYQPSVPAGSPVEFSYRYSALVTNGPNKKYVKKEQKKGYQVVAVQLKNNTTTDLNFSRDLELTFADRPIQPVASFQAGQDLKQGVAIYLLYILLNMRVGSRTYVNGRLAEDNTTFVPLGSFIALGNILGSSMANNNMKTELAKYDLTNKVLRPGETVYGILAIRESNVAPLKISLRNQATPALTPAAPATSPLPAGSGQ